MFGMHHLTYMGFSTAMAEPEVPVYYHSADSSPLQPAFIFDAPPLYHPHGALEDISIRPSHMITRAPTTARLGKRGSQDSTASDFASMNVVEDFAAEHPPSKRSRKEPLPSGRVSGACTRCKRLKMKCTFADSDSTCARCIVGGHECVVLGRKPRSPG
ncbi:hypothetical protein NM688_g8147 [Phlebia brevispora]|uniref:Uncharacterized protein n=1 Tax=Phlebia brevispora TaxID=194682 RepID=A0ACC1RWR3_9APHY|nr:hypothetical protein NM688_g8147 [Phlebia brevispora]